MKKHTSNHDQHFNIIIQSVGESDCAVNGPAVSRSLVVVAVHSQPWMLPDRVFGKQIAMCQKKMGLAQEDLQDAWGLLIELQDARSAAPSCRKPVAPSYFAGCLWLLHYKQVVTPVTVYFRCGFPTHMTTLHTHIHKTQDTHPHTHSNSDSLCKNI